MPIRYDLMQRFSFIMAIINLAAVLFFLVLLFVVPMFTNLSARGNFLKLDQAGAINTQALPNMSEDSGFKMDADPTAYRTAIPDYIAAAPASAQRFAATSGLLISLTNMVIFYVLWFVQKRASVEIIRTKKKQDQDTPPRGTGPDEERYDISA